MFSIQFFLLIFLIKRIFSAFCSSNIFNPVFQITYPPSLSSSIFNLYSTTLPCKSFQDNPLISVLIKKNLQRVIGWSTKVPINMFWMDEWSYSLKHKVVNHVSFKMLWLCNILLQHMDRKKYIWTQSKYLQLPISFWECPSFYCTRTDRLS